jgi:endonuclease/exonuclease/phosphatase family metal-dependent hydrolase
MKNKLLLFATTLLFTFSSFADVAVVTFNAAQLKKHGFDFVPCTNRRIQPLMENLFLNDDAPAHSQKYFVITLQEMWTKKVFKATEAAVKKMGYQMFPRDHESVKSNGVITVTNMKMLEANFTPYSHDTYAKKGILYTLLQTDEGQKIGVLNIHTGFSGKKTPSSTHLRQFYEVGEFAMNKQKESDYFVIAGDFNSGPDMVLEKEEYAIAETVWNVGLIPVMNSAKMIHVPQSEITWDQTHNPLVYDPTATIKLFNLIDHKNTRWGQNDSTMDHIFVSESVEIQSAKLVFKDPVPLHCPNRTNEEGKSTLSDHYGVMATLKLKDPAPITINE